MKIIVDIESASIEKSIEAMERIKDIAIVKDVYLEELTK